MIVDYDMGIFGLPVQDVKCKVFPASLFSRLIWKWLRFTIKMTWEEAKEPELERSYKSADQILALIPDKILNKVCMLGKSPIGKPLGCIEIGFCENCEHRILDIEKAKREERTDIGEGICVLVGNLMLEDIEAGKLLGEQLKPIFSRCKTGSWQALKGRR